MVVIFIARTKKRKIDQLQFVLDDWGQKFMDASSKEFLKARTTTEHLLTHITPTPSTYTNKHTANTTLLHYIKRTHQYFRQLILWPIRRRVNVHLVGEC